MTIEPNYKIVKKQSKEHENLYNIASINGAYQPHSTDSELCC